MTIAEILKAKGVTDDVIQAIQEDMKTNKIFTASEENLDIRYGKLKTDHEGTVAELTEAQKLIEDLKKSSKGNEDLQGKITGYESQVAALQEQLQETKRKSAMKIALLSENVEDVDYLTFKLEEQLKKEGKTVELDDNDSIKGWEDMLSGLKTQFPKQFTTNTDGGYKVVDPQKLPRGGSGDAIPTKDEFKAMTYEQRLALKQKNEDLYKQLKN